MFFNVTGIKWTLLAIAVVILFCALDLRCAAVRDERDRAAQSGIIGHVREEFAAGQREFSQQRADQLAEQIRDLRVMAKRLVEKGETVRARATISLIQEL